MKFKSNSTALANALKSCAAILENSMALQITECFLLELQGDNLYILTTNIETSIKTSTKVDGKEDGIVAINRQFLETLTLLEANSSVSISTDDKFLVTQTAKGKFKIPFEDHNDFPAAKFEKFDTSMACEFQDFQKGIVKTTFATSSDEMRLAMTGVLVEFKEGKAEYTATDASTLSSYTTKAKTAQEARFVLPKKLCSLVCKMKESGGVTIYTSDSRVTISTLNYQISALIVDAKFPDWQSVIPITNNVITVNKKDFKASLKRVLIFANKNTNMAIMEVRDCLATIETADLDFSTEAKETMHCEQLSPFRFAFDAKRMITCIDNYEGEEFNIHVAKQNKKPILMRSENHLLLCTPIIDQYSEEDDSEEDDSEEDDSEENAN